MFQRKNKELTKLQKEFIVNKDNKIKARLKLLAKVLLNLGTAAIGCVISYYLCRKYVNWSEFPYIFIVSWTIPEILFFIVCGCKKIICKKVTRCK